MEFKSTFWAIVMFSMIIFAAGVMINEQSKQYDSTLVSDLGGFNKLDSLSDSAGVQKGSLNPQSSETSSDYEAQTYRGVYGIISNIFSPFSVVLGKDGILQLAVVRWNIPPYIYLGFITLFVFAIIFGIIAIIFRLGRTSA